MRPSSHTTAAAPLPFWNRVARQLGVALPDATPDLRRGERHTVIGLTIAAVVWLCIVLGGVLRGDADPVRAIALFVVVLLVIAGILAGSRIARWLAMPWAFVGIARVLVMQQLVRDMSNLTFAEALSQLDGTSRLILLMCGGILFATLSQPARRWQHARREHLKARRERGAKSMADWRAAAPEDSRAPR